MNNEDIKSKGILKTIISFMKKIFFMNSPKLLTEGPELSAGNVGLNVTKISTIKDTISIPKDVEKERILSLRSKWENGEIDESEISDEDINAIVEIYNAETEKLKQETEQIKQNIAKILKKLKESA